MLSTAKKRQESHISHVVVMLRVFPYSDMGLLKDTKGLLKEYQQLLLLQPHDVSETCSSSSPPQRDVFRQQKPLKLFVTGAQLQLFSLATAADEDLIACNRNGGI